MVTTTATTDSEKPTGRSKVGFEWRAARRFGRYDRPRRIRLVADQKRVLIIGDGRENPTSFLEPSDEFHVLRSRQSQSQMRSRDVTGVPTRQLTLPEPLSPCCLQRATSWGRFSE